MARDLLVPAEDVRKGVCDGCGTLDGTEMNFANIRARAVSIYKF